MNTSYNNPQETAELTYCETEIRFVEEVFLPKKGGGVSTSRYRPHCYRHGSRYLSLYAWLLAPLFGPASEGENGR
jgi:hypothetical protein